jgi:hypothetical protein
MHRRYQVLVIMLVLFVPMRRLFTVAGPYVPADYRNPLGLVVIRCGRSVAATAIVNRQTRISKEVL